MRNAVLIPLVGILLGSLLTIGAIYALPEEPQPKPSSSSSLPSPLEQPEAYPYLLKAYQGKLAVFTEDLIHPDLVFDVYLKTLPELDQQQLQQGIRIQTYEELTSRIEDYIS